MATAAFGGAVAFIFAVLPPSQAKTKEVNAERLQAGRLEPWTGAAWPTFSLPDTRGDTLTLDAVRRHVAVVHFFATWCQPCRDELPALNRLVRRSHGKIRVLGVSVAEVDLAVRRFLSATPTAFPILLDRDRTTAKAWKVATLPTSFVLDGDLHPRFVVEAEFDWDSIEPGAFAAKVGAVAAKAAIETNATTRKKPKPITDANNQ